MCVHRCVVTVDRLPRRREVEANFFIFLPTESLVFRPVSNV